jgi:hypothetical protein
MWFWLFDTYKLTMFFLVILLVTRVSPYCAGWLHKFTTFFRENKIYLAKL